MSNVYSMEPNTGGRVTLTTTHGPLYVELWSKECPLASRNFIQLCMEGYYDGTAMHRIVPGFCVQGGRPAKRYTDSSEEETRNGAAACEGGCFPIETHSRLRWNRRGLFGMAAAGTDPKRPNGSQFFFSLGDASELNGKATLFGRLVGDSVFNLLRMGETEVDPVTETPLYPPHVISTEVTLNPFSDIVPRERAVVVVKEESPASTRSAALAKRNVALLSFAEEEATGSERSDKGGHSAGMKSSHDILNDPKLSKTATATGEKVPEGHTRLSTSTPSSAATTSSLQFLHQMKAMQMRDTQKNIEAMERELGLRPPVKDTVNSAKPSATSQPKQLSAVEKHRQKYLEQGRAHSAKRKPDATDEMNTLLHLNTFRQKIQKATQQQDTSHDTGTVSQAATEPPKHLDICKLHGLVDCLSCRDTFGVRMEDADEKEDGWMMHRLVFDRQQLDKSIRADLQQLVVIDPREQSDRLFKQQQKKK